MKNKIKYLCLLPALCTSLSFPMIGLINRSNSLVDSSLKRSEVFFDVDNKETLNDHILDMKTKIKDISAIIRDTCQLYKISEDKTYIALLEVLLPARKMLCMYYNTLKQQYSSVLDLALALKKMMNEIQKGGLLGEFWAGMVNLEIALSGNELANFYYLKDSIESYKIPGYADCMIALNKYF